MVDYRKVGDSSILDWIKQNHRFVSLSVDDDRGSLRPRLSDFYEYGVSQAIGELVDEATTSWLGIELDHETHVTNLE